MHKAEIGDSTLYLGDALEILPQITGVDLVVSDPPYRITSGGNTTRVMVGGKFDPELYDNGGQIVPCEIDWCDFMKPIYDTMNRGHAYIMCNDKNMHDALVEAKKSGFRFHNILVWDKGTMTPNRWYMKNCEFIIFLFKGNAVNIKDCGSPQLVKVPNILNASHPTEKPVALMKYYISNSSERGQTVLDPFMGSGSTGVAAHDLGRKFIGIEKEEKWFDHAVKRLENRNKINDDEQELLEYIQENLL